MNTLMQVLALLIPMCLVGCGSAPVSTELTVADASVTQTFAWNDYNGICNALRSWVPSQTNIQFPTTASAHTVYMFTNTKITQNGIILNNYSNFIGVGAPHVCDYQLVNGKLVNVTN